MNVSLKNWICFRYYQRIMLSPWGNYSFRVLAKNKLGTSRPSKPTARICSTPPDVPHHNPRGICTINRKPHQLVITWKVSECVCVCVCLCVGVSVRMRVHVHVRMFVYVCVCEWVCIHVCVCVFGWVCLHVSVCVSVCVCVCVWVSVLAC